MTELGSPQVAPGGLMKIGTVAAQNIAVATGLEAHVKTIESAIADEINAMSAHFTLAVSDVQTQYEIDLAKIKSTYSFVSAHRVAIGVTAFVVFLVGAIVGKLV